MSKAYSFLIKSETDETHIFEGDFNKEGGCGAVKSSVCKKATTADGIWIDQAVCLTDAQARNKAAQIGRAVCGTCVSHLYTTY